MGVKSDPTVKSGASTLCAAILYSPWSAMNAFFGISKCYHVEVR
jgi:hypothetical protein